MEISAPILSKQQVFDVGKHGNCVSSQVIAKEREYVAVMSVGMPSGVLWHVVCPKLCCALPEASHLTRYQSSSRSVVPGICQSSLWVQLGPGKRCSLCLGSNSDRLAIPCTLTHFPSVFPVVSRLIIGSFFLSIRSTQRFSVGVISFCCSVVRC